MKSVERWRRLKMYEWMYVRADPYIPCEGIIRDSIPYYLLYPPTLYSFQLDKHSMTHSLPYVNKYNIFETSLTGNNELH